MISFSATLVMYYIQRYFLKILVKKQFQFCCKRDLFSKVQINNSSLWVRLLYVLATQN